MVQLVREIYHHNFSWNDIKHNQLSELYLSMMLRTLGLSLIGIFIPVYLYQLGYSVADISLFYVIVYGVRIISDSLAAFIIGYYGPKHVMILSHIFLIISLALLLTLETSNWPLSLIAFVIAIASGMFFMSYHIEFSKIQSVKKAGKEIGIMYKLSKLAGASGPLIGGALATYFNVQVTIIFAMIVILFSGIPLVLSPEPVRKRQHITWKGFPWREVKWDLISNFGLTFDQMATLLIWPLYVSIFIFSDNVYLSVGLITSAGLAVSFFVTTIYGKAIDRYGGNRLLRFGVLGESIEHFARLLIVNPVGAILFNLVSDPTSIAIRMPYTKGLYGAASSHEGYRDAYLATIMASSNVMRTFTFIVVYVVASGWDDKLALQVIFIMSGFSVWTTVLHRYKALK